MIACSGAGKGTEFKSPGAGEGQSSGNLATIFRPSFTSMSSQRHRRKARIRFLPGPESLEGRALLSRSGASLPASADAQAIVVSSYETILHREPRPFELARWARTLDHGGNSVQLAIRLVTSPEYTRSHRGNVAFVDGLYRDLEGRMHDAKGEAYWLRALNSRQINRTGVALAFLAPSPTNRPPWPGPPPKETPPPAAQGVINSVYGPPGQFPYTINNSGPIPSVSGALVFNYGIKTLGPLTITVSGPGTYAIDHLAPANPVRNNTELEWGQYNFQITSGAATFVPNLSQAGPSNPYLQIPSTNSPKNILAFGGITLPARNPVTKVATVYQPYAVFQVTGTGPQTITIQEYFGLPRD
jgi:hypothetical protein